MAPHPYQPSMAPHHMGMMAHNPMQPVAMGMAPAPPGAQAAAFAAGVKRPAGMEPTAGSSSPGGYDVHHAAKRQKADELQPAQLPVAAGGVGLAPGAPAAASMAPGPAAPVPDPSMGAMAPTPTAAATAAAERVDQQPGQIASASGAGAAPEPGAAAPAAAAAGPAAAPPAPKPVAPRKPRQQTEDEKRLLPKRGLAMVMKAAGLHSDFVLEPALEVALMELYGDFVANALAMGCEVAKQRKSRELKARDMSLHLASKWNLHIMGFAGDALRPYRRANASELHRQRHLAVRRTAVEMEQQAGASAAPGPSTQGGAGQ